MGPDHAFEAVHAVASVLLQVNVTLFPLDIDSAFAVMVTVGIGVGGGATVTVTDFGRLVPPSPVQVIEKIEVDVSDPVPCEPDALLAPDHAPPASHDVASLLDQVNVDPSVLYAREAGLAVNVTTVGTNGAATVIVTDLGVLAPLALEHVNV